MLSSEIYQRIIQAWEVDQNFPGRMRRQKPLPDVRDVRALIEMAFWASLKREEERPVTFNIALLPKSDVAREIDFGASGQVLLTFNRSLPLTVESIAKLAVAFDPKTTAFVVAPVDKERTEYEMWGVIFFGYPRNQFKEIPLSEEGLRFLLRPDVLMVNATAAGSLMITRGDGRIASLASGEIILPTPDPFSSFAMGNLLIDMIKGDPGYIQYQHSYWHWYSYALANLLTEASSRGHGGTIIIMPGKRVEEYKEHLLARYSFEESLQIETTFTGFVERQVTHADMLSSVAFGRAYVEKLRFLAQLSNIDGALVINSRLEVIAFGSTLRAPSWQGDVVVGPDGFGGGGAKFDASKLGTRHNSAINFVGACPESAGFVISQDGPIRGFARRDDATVLCWPDCRVSMFV